MTTRHLTSTENMQPALWHPYTQMHAMSEPLEVVGGQGPRMLLSSGEMLLDATCSWWCMIHGYGHPRLVTAIQQQAAELCHVMLGGIRHRPAMQLAEALARITPPGLDHVFFSDSGSVGMEVAMKMAVQYQQQRQDRTDTRGRTRMLSLMKAYHGDTAGCMAVCDPEEGMHSLFADFLPQHHFAPAPTAGFHASQHEVAQDIAALRACMTTHQHEIAALLMEPLLQAAGGLNMYSPYYLKAARELCDEFGVVLIFDEVATGFGRTGKLFACEHADISPDIMVLSKGLTGGYLGHAATIAQSHIFHAFDGKDANSAFMHGPTFMGNPLACRVALESLAVFEEENYLEKIASLNQILREELLTFSHSAIRDIRVLGATAVIEVHDAQSLEGVQAHAREQGVWLRPFGRWLYTMPAYITEEDDMRHITRTMKRHFSTLSRQHQS